MAGVTWPVIDRDLPGDVVEGAPEPVDGEPPRDPDPLHHALERNAQVILPIVRSGSVSPSISPSKFVPMQSGTAWVVSSRVRSRAAGFRSGRFSKMLRKHWSRIVADHLAHHPFVREADQQIAEAAPG
jgi:hypothetical protein